MISERDYAPLSAACVRSLNDKVYDKRKPAATEIEKMVKEFSARNNTVQIKKLLKVLGQDFATSQNSHTRKGGLIGLAAIAVGLGKDTGQYTEELIRPILACFSDPDIHVRYYACESLYNVVKIARSAVLPLFTDIFGALSKLACDPEQNVKNATELLDRLMKDIVTESGMFDLVGFMPILRERIYIKSPFGRQFMISWVSVLDAVPDMDFVIILPEILDGLFIILEDPTPEIKKITDTVLGEFLRSIKANPSRVDFPGMINILIVHAQSADELLQLTAISWIREFVQLSGPSMLPFASGILSAILPCLAYDSDNRKNIKETAAKVNSCLMELITTKDLLITCAADRKDKKSMADDGIESKEIKSLGISDSSEADSDKKKPEGLNLSKIVEVLTKHLKQTSVQTKIAALKWIYHLFIHIPDKMYNHIDELFPVLMRTLGDNSDEVVQQNLVVIAEIISPQITVTAKEKNKSGLTSSPMGNKYFTKFIVNLLRLFSTDRHLLEDKGAFIIRELCVLLSAEEIYKILAKILLEEQNLRFAGIMIQTLNVILLTSSELFELRNKLKDLKNEESRKLFVCLYESWCHNPVATMALCLLGQNYAHACDLVKSFANIEVTVEFLTEIDKLVQLIESPIFTYLRLELLEPERNESLVRTLYGLLMILPQSEAFGTLQRRLTAIPPASSVIVASKSSESTNKNKHTDGNHVGIDFARLLKHFESVQEKHKEQKHRQRLNMLVDRDSTPPNHGFDT
ncbi:protein VAC14 homolog [Microplitis mediator]|uniref:protein VAC14 homolog n=1 Tax=Microplitis mediator TaxID=375433 RepID=UPI0025575118|nr:protein VAC14 homolog [Microplitis mediator]XP_057330111.1 protein VAC14 homolog [Microplitis mediator]